MPQMLMVTRVTSLFCLLSLLALYGINALVAEPFSWLLWLLPSGSIVIFLPGMLANDARTYNWLCFAILLHFTVGVTNAMSPMGQITDYIQIALSSILFLSAMMTSRWLQVWQQATNQKG